MTDQSTTTAVLGPTNTGKTHYAMSRMLAHGSGIIGFPLRLLARENYDRAVAAKGADHVALITGEEKILPKDAKWFLCTVEAMPLDRDVAFVGIDEIQMCADPDRGHVFTDRLLHARGRNETMFMGAETIRPVIETLVPEVEIVTRPRFSVLTHVGPKKISRLPRRSAVVSFTASDVYALAELIRRQRGGAAVVLGALSPRTRNAQVEMYQSGDVDYLVATDAIGMGLNMDVDHVAFAATKKFDGRRVRNLSPAELGQVAGRAGRHMNDGTFGTTADAGLLDEELATRIEEHDFDPLQEIYWRNADIDTSSIDALCKSLRRRPHDPGLTLARRGDDEIILDRLKREQSVIDAVTHPSRVQLLWEVCQIPDFRGVMSDAHANLGLAIFNRLCSGAEVLPTDWVATNVAHLDRVDGDMDTLMARIAGIRTWTYVSFRNGWVDDPEHWQARTREIEDKLSDALHDRLTQRFVDRKTSFLVAKLKDVDDLTTAVRHDGEVLIEGEPVGHLEGLRFTFDGIIEGDAGRAVANAAHRAVRKELTFAVTRLCTAQDGDLTLSNLDDVMFPKVLWQDAPIAQLRAGHDPLYPDVAIIASDALEPADRDRAEKRIKAWVSGRIDAALAPLLGLKDKPLAGAARGLAYQLREGFGSLRRRDAKAQIDALSRDDRRALRTAGVRLGRDMAFLPALLKPEAVKWRAVLWCLSQNRKNVPELPPDGRVSIPLQKGADATFLEAIGYRPLGPLAVRIDMAERLTSQAWQLAKDGPFAATVDLTSLIGASNEELPKVLNAIGFKRTQKTAEDGTTEALYAPRRQGQKSGKPRRKGGPKRPVASSDSPFAVLKELTIGE